MLFSYVLASSILNVFFRQPNPITSGVLSYRVKYLLLLALVLCPSILFSFALFTIACIFTSYLLAFHLLLISLLYILVYLGGLIVLFAYMWMFITHSSRIGLFYPLTMVLLYGLFGSRYSFPHSLSSYLYPTSIILFLVCTLFWTIVISVLILDLGLGGFSS